MAYLDDADAPELFESESERVGYVPNYARAFAHRPEVYRAWRGLVEAIQADADFRRFELATLAAARRLRSTYCSLAHGKVLTDRFYSAEQVVALPGGLDEADRAVMELADKVAADSTSVTQADVDRLRTLGLTDAEITDVVLAAAARAFFSTVLDALGAEPDSVYAELEPSLRSSLTVGRPFPARPQPG